MDADFYSLLNVPEDASIRQIEKQYRSISRQIHPDKQRPNGMVNPDMPEEFVFNGVSTDDLTQRNEVFVDIQKAYGYLSNPLTKVIYDEYGVGGLAVYEKSKRKFQSLQEELRSNQQSMVLENTDVSGQMTDV